MCARIYVIAVRMFVYAHLEIPAVGSWVVGWHHHFNISRDRHIRRGGLWYNSSECKGDDLGSGGGRLQEGSKTSLLNGETTKIMSRVYHVQNLYCIFKDRKVLLWITLVLTYVLTYLRTYLRTYKSSSVEVILH